MNAVKWHSTTQHHSYKRSEISNNPHRNLQQMSFQDLTALRYYIEYEIGMPPLGPFTNTWFQHMITDNIIFPWVITIK